MPELFGVMGTWSPLPGETLLRGPYGSVSNARRRPALERPSSEPSGHFVLFCSAAFALPVPGWVRLAGRGNAGLRIGDITWRTEAREDWSPCCCIDLDVHLCFCAVLQTMSKTPCLTNDAYSVSFQCVFPRLKKASCCCLKSHG